jgi:hypothetical protein
MNRQAAIAVFAWSFAAAVWAQDFDSAVSRIAPPGVRLGLSLDELKVTRPAVIEGPSATMPGSTRTASPQFPTYMENQGVGRPGHISYWYLLSQDKVVGILKTTNLVGVDLEAGNMTAQRMFSELAELLGRGQEESILRKGQTAFVPVRADVWKSAKSGQSIYFIATDKEITSAALAQSDFPFSQVLIRPNAERFPLEAPAERTIRDLERTSPAEPERKQVAALATPTADIESKPAVKNADSSNQSISQTPDDKPNADTEENPFWLLFVVFGIAIFAGVAIAVRYFGKRAI